jgi:hypothetical protein
MCGCYVCSRSQFSDHAADRARQPAYRDVRHDLSRSTSSLARDHTRSSASDSSIARGSTSFNIVCSELANDSASSPRMKTPGQSLPNCIRPVSTLRVSTIFRSTPLAAAILAFRSLRSDAGSKPKGLRVLSGRAAMRPRSSPAAAITAQTLRTRRGIAEWLVARMGPTTYRRWSINRRRLLAPLRFSGAWLQARFLHDF